MSAGGLSYSGLVNYGKLTLPSVATWGTNMNILRDPPKSYYTKKKDKVGDTSSITDLVDQSDRNCEAIQVYARGVNPFVSVSYSNNGNNGGQHASGIQVGGQQATKLPYRIMDKGAFRPPVLLQQDLLPLSRMPRNNISALAKPEFIDYSRKMRTYGTAEETKEVHTDTLKACVRPTAVYHIETPINESFEVKYVIKPCISNSVNSGVRSMDVKQKYTGKPTKEIDKNPLHVYAQANYVDNKYKNINKFNPDRYLQSTNTHAVVSNISSDKKYTAIDDILDLSNLPVHDDILHSGTSSKISGISRTKYIHEEIDMSRNIPEYNVITNINNNIHKRVNNDNEIELQRNLPEYNTTTNITDPNVHKRIEYDNEIQLERNIPMNSFVSNPTACGNTDHSSREARLIPKISPGGYSIPGQIPKSERVQHGTTLNSEKSRMNQMVLNSFQDRFSKPFPLKTSQ